MVPSKRDGRVMTTAPSVTVADRCGDRVARERLGPACSTAVALARSGVELRHQVVDLGRRDRVDERDESAAADGERSVTSGAKQARVCAASSDRLRLIGSIHRSSSTARMRAGVRSGLGLFVEVEAEPDEERDASVDVGRPRAGWPAGDASSARGRGRAPAVACRRGRRSCGRSTTPTRRLVRRSVPPTVRPCRRG